MHHTHRFHDRIDPADDRERINRLFRLSETARRTGRHALAEDLALTAAICVDLYRLGSEHLKSLLDLAEPRSLARGLRG